MKRKRFAALLAALALCVTGCARAESAPMPGPQPSPEPSPSPAASPAVEAGDTFRWLCNTLTGEVVSWPDAPGADRRLVSLGREWSLFSSTPPGAGQTRFERIATDDLLAGSGQFLSAG